MTGISYLDRTCENCKHVAVCSPFRALVSFEQNFKMEYGKIVEPPFTSILLAKNCEAYESPIEHGMFGGLSDAELIEMNTAIELSLSRERTSDRQVAESLKKLVGAELYRRTERRKNNTIEV